MSEKNKPSYWAVLPASVRYDPELPPNAKLLYAELSALADAAGYCFANNEYFAGNFELNVKSIQRLLKALADRGYIIVDVVRDAETHMSTNTMIRCHQNAFRYFGGYPEEILYAEADDGRGKRPAGTG